VVFGAATRPTDPSVGNRTVVTVNALEAGHAVGVKTYRGSVDDVVVDGVPVNITLNGEWSDALTDLQQAIDPAVFVAGVGTAVTQDGLVSPWSHR
jgi:phage gp37-like protein